MQSYSFGPQIYSCFSKPLISLSWPLCWQVQERSNMFQLERPDMSIFSPNISHRLLFQTLDSLLGPCAVHVPAERTLVPSCVVVQSLSSPQVLLLTPALSYHAVLFPPKCPMPLQPQVLLYLSLLTPVFATWSLASSALTAPRARRAHAAAWDAVERRWWLHGGRGEETLLEDLWIWETWQ